MTYLINSLLNIEEKILMFFQDYIRLSYLTPVIEFITFLANKGWFWIALSLVLFLIPRTRKIGFASCAACAIDVLVVNIIMKNIFARPRPYELFEALVPIVSKLSHLPDDFSFPSGHTAISFAVAIVLLVKTPKKFGIPAIFLATLIALTRLYLGVHYPTDILAGTIIGIGAGLLGIFVCNLIEPRLNFFIKNTENSKVDFSQND